MAIIKQIRQYTAPQEVLLNLFPDQFVPEGIGIDSQRRLVDDKGNYYPIPNQRVSNTTKMSEDWWKINMDYFYTVALAQYNWNSPRICRNYELMKGHLTPADFYLEGPVMSIMDEVMRDVELPAYVKHYPILNPPINTMVGEKSKRPDIARPKCVDDDSKSEEGQFYTQLLQSFIEQGIREKVVAKLKEKGQDTSDVEEFNQQVEQLTSEDMREYRGSYTTNAEVWANNMLSALKVEFNTKELFENGFRDMLVSNYQHHHVYEDRSKTGFRVAKENPKNVWWLTTPDKKYLKDAYAAGTVYVMELSEILDKYDLTDEEVEHLRRYASQAFFPYSKLSNFYTGETGVESIQYNPYDPAVLRERNFLESQMTADGQQRLDGIMGNAAPSVGTFGNRFIVTRAYWRSKKKIGLLTYINKDGDEESVQVDDSYKDGQHPQQLSITWKWENQWYQGDKIGNDIYYVKPLECIDYCPIIGVTYEIENTVSTSLVDLMKPFQTIYNICMNQIYRMLEKEKGKAVIMNKASLPIPKGGTYEDAKQMWETEFEETGVMWIDTSLDALKGSAPFNQFSVIDASLSEQINARFQLAIAMKNECWELIGINRERTGGIAASQTATGTNTAISQSYAQTEPYFVQQEYLENQVLQCILDFAQYIECNKPESTISFIDSEGGNQFCKLQTALHLRNKDIKLFMSNRYEDQQFRESLKELSQPALQNGVSMYEVALMRKEQSTRKILEMLKEWKEKNDTMLAQNQEMQQRAQQLAEQKEQATIQQAIKEHNDNIQVEIYKTDTKANTDITVARIQEGIQIAKENQSSEGPDMLDIMAQHQKEQDSVYKRDIEQLRLQMDQQQQQFANREQIAEGMRKDRKLDLEEKGLELKEKQLKQQAKKKAQTAK